MNAILQKVAQRALALFRSSSAAEQTRMLEYAKKVDATDIPFTETLKRVVKGEGSLSAGELFTVGSSLLVGGHELWNIFSDDDLGNEIVKKVVDRLKEQAALRSETGVEVPVPEAVASEPTSSSAELSKMVNLVKVQLGYPATPAGDIAFAEFLTALRELTGSTDSALANLFATRANFQIR